MKEQDPKQVSNNPVQRLPIENKQRQLQQFTSKTSYIPIQTKIQQKIQKIFRDFAFSSITFYIFLTNCLTWLSVHIVYWANRYNWDCTQFLFFAKFQPSITYDYEIWRLVLSSLMFRGWIQFYFNNFALNMLGYVIQKKSKMQFMIIFYGGILSGHMLSCCFSRPDQLTVGTSCGTIALLPLQLCRYFRLRKTNPIQAVTRRRFIIFNIASNFILNILAIFRLDPVDWISHIGCLILGILLMITYQCKQLQAQKQKQFPAAPRQTILAIIAVKYLTIVLIILYLLVMGVIIWGYLPRKAIGRDAMQEMLFKCDINNLLKTDKNYDEEADFIVVIQKY